MLKLTAALVFLSLAAPAMADDICADRPGKGTAVCTVPKGRLQIETDLVDLTHDKSGGETTTLLALGAPQLKLGLTDHFDIEAGLTAYERQTTREPSGSRTRIGGFGDLYLRAKAGVLDEDKGGIGLAVEPFVKLATARKGLGNGATEGGLVVPAEIVLPKGWKLDLTTEFDRLEDQAGGGHHWAGSETVGLNHGLGSGFTGAVEVWADHDWDPMGKSRLYSLDFALAWVPKSGKLQLDGGVNLGLNPATPDVQLYLGLSRLF